MTLCAKILSLKKIKKIMFLIRISQFFKILNKVRGVHPGLFLPIMDLVLTSWSDAVDGLGWGGSVITEKHTYKLSL